ncbi:unnamed protein product, partial [Porites evermanni]
MSLVGQDFPLYRNKQFVRALQGLNNTYNIAHSMPKRYSDHIERSHFNRNTTKRKAPPPHNISIYKGSTHIIALREFDDFALHSQIAKDFDEFLKETQVPGETMDASLQHLPGAPGGIKGKQPKWIQWAMNLTRTRQGRRGIWVGNIFRISLEDLRWAVGENNKEKRFVHTI